jgi:hypothetical protein
MSDVAYPYRAFYPRTSTWYEKDWREISTWCNECIGPGEWEFYNSEFVFAQERHYMLFKLKWIL